MPKVFEKQLDEQKIPHEEVIAYCETNGDIAACRVYKIGFTALQRFKEDYQKKHDVQICPEPHNDAVAFVLEKFADVLEGRFVNMQKLLDAKETQLQKLEAENIALKKELAIRNAHVIHEFSPRLQALAGR